MNKRLMKLVRMCGLYPIARHLKNRGYTLEQTATLLGIEVRHG